MSEEVPEENSTNRVGVDRGQNQLATAVPKQGFGLLFSGKEVKHRRRCFQERRRQLQKTKKYQDGVIGSPRNSMNIINGRATAVQLSLFDCTNYETRRENPRSLATKGA